MRPSTRLGDLDMDKKWGSKHSAVLRKYNIIVYYCFLSSFSAPGAPPDHFGNKVCLHVAFNQFTWARDGRFPNTKILHGMRNRAAEMVTKVQKLETSVVLLSQTVALFPVSTDEKHEGR